MNERKKETLKLTIHEKHWQAIIYHLRKRFCSNPEYLPLLEREAQKLQQLISDQLDTYLGRLEQREGGAIGALSYEELKLRDSFFSLHSGSIVWQIITNVRCNHYKKGDYAGAEMLETFRHPAPYRHFLRWKLSIKRIFVGVMRKYFREQRLNKH